jgi:predicted SAM-dependent methyltransferase
MVNMAGIIKKIKSAAPAGAKNYLRRIIFRGLLSKIYRPVVNELYIYRESVANMYIRGAAHGIEIGALDRPMRLPCNMKTLQVDRMPEGQLVNEYRNKKIRNLVHVDIYDDGEKLGKIEDSSQEYVIANHFLEHCRNPIFALSNMLRVLKKDGILFLSVPDKRYIFDSERPVTPFPHLVQDYENGPELSDKNHYEEWTRFVLKADVSDVQNKAASLMAACESIHFHVWTQVEILELILGAKKFIAADYEIVHFSKNGYEVVVVVRKY